jgi:hypothetical protein
MDDYLSFPSEATGRDSGLDKERWKKGLIGLLYGMNWCRHKTAVTRTTNAWTSKTLEKEREQIVARVDAETLTPDQIRTIEEFGVEIRKGLAHIDKNFEAQRQLIDLLDVTGRLVKENGELVIYAVYHRDKYFTCEENHHLCAFDA